MPSLKPMRLRGVSCARLVDEVRPKPSCDQRTVTAPRPMRARLRTAWKATCGSSAHACTQRSPPLRARSSSSPGSAGRSRSGAGRWPASPKRSSKSDGPSPKVTVRRAGVEPERLAGVLRRRERHVVDVARPGARPSCARPPATTRAAARAGPWRAGPPRRRRRRSAAGPAPAWRCPAWWRPWNGDRRVGGARRLGVVLAAQRRTRRPAAAAIPPPAADASRARRDRRAIATPTALAQAPARAARPARRSPR